MAPRSHRRGDRARCPSGELAPVDGKRLLARTVVDLYHGEGAGAEAEAEFDRVFRDHSIPEEVAEFVVDPAELRDGRVRVARLLALAFPSAVPSNKEGRRKIEQGGVRLDGDVVEDPDLELTAADLDGKLAAARPAGTGPASGANRRVAAGGVPACRREPARVYVTKIQVSMPTTTITSTIAAAIQ